MAEFLNDTFTDSDGVKLHDHTGETGATWAQNGALTGTTREFEIRSNRIAPENANNTKAYYSSGVPASADYEIEALIRMVSLADTIYTSIVARMSTSADTGYHLRYDSQNTRWELRSTVAGSSTSLGTWSESLSAGDERTVKLRVVGDSIKGYVAGVERISVTDSSITAAGRAGLRSAGAGSGSVNHHVDWITATDVVAGAAGVRSRLVSLGVG